MSCTLFLPPELLARVERQQQQHRLHPVLQELTCTVPLALPPINEWTGCTGWLMNIDKWMRPPDDGIFSLAAWGLAESTHFIQECFYDDYVIDFTETECIVLKNTLLYFGSRVASDAQKPELFWS